LVESADAFNVGGTPNTPSGWTKIFEETQSEGVNGCTTLTIFAKVAGASESNVTVDGVLNHLATIMLCYSGASPVVGDIQVGTGNGADTGNGTVTGLTTAVANCLVIAVCATTRDLADTATFSSWTNANLSSLTERHNQTVSTGAGGGFGVVDGLKATAGATGNTTVTIAVSDKWRAVHLALKAGSISGTASITQAGDASSATGTLQLKATSSVTQAGNTVSATSTLQLRAVLAATQASNTVSASGASSSPISGVVNITQQNNSLNAAGEDPNTPSGNDSHHDSLMGVHWCCLPRRRVMRSNSRGRVHRI
jgi:hypothetical protein